MNVPSGHPIKFPRRGLFVGFAMLVAVTAIPVADARAQSSEDTRAMLDRMERLERDIRDLNLQVARGSLPATSGRPATSAASSASADAVQAGPAAARLAVRMTALEDDLRNVTGAMEEVQFRIGEIRKRLDKLVSDIDYRLSALEGRPGGAPAPKGQPAPTTPRVSAAPSPPPVEKVVPGSGNGFAKPPGTLGTVSEAAVGAITPPQQAAAPAAAKPAAPSPAAPAKPAAPPPASVLPAGTVKQQYDFAFSLLRQANYDQAEVALHEFVRLHPKDPLASNARYWLGETYYVRAAYVQAAEVFLEGYQADSKGPKAPDSLLKLGMSLAGLDKKREACAAFDKLIKDFPNANAGLKNTVAREKQKSGCS